MNDQPPFDEDALSLDTMLVQGGIARSQFGETSEALFLNSGFVYDTAQAAEARFKGESPGFIYSRYANPTVAMFEARMAMIEGAEAARGTASGMAAVNAALMCQLRAGDHVVAARALFGSCLYVVEDLLPRFGVNATLVDGTDLDQWRDAVRPETKVFFLETPDQSDARRYRPRRRLRNRPRRRRTGRRRQCFRHPARPAADGARRRCRGLFRHQAHRRRRALPGWRDPRQRSSSSPRN
jgi:hypothetical protein